MVKASASAYQKARSWRGVVAHGQHAVLRALELRRRVGGDEAVHLPAVPAHVLGGPFVRQVEGALGVGGGRVEMERQQRRGRGPPAEPPMLAEDARRARSGRRSRAPLVGAEVVVERAVLVHEEDDVLDGAEVGAGRGDVEPPWWWPRRTPPGPG